MLAKFRPRVNRSKSIIQLLIYIPTMEDIRQFSAKLFY